MSDNLPNVTEPFVNETPIDKVRRFLEVLRFKTNDMNKYKKDMDMGKMQIKILLDKYKSSQNNITIHTQQMLVDINDEYKKFKEMEEKYLKTKRHVDNIQRMIVNMNIKPYINNVIEEFNFEL